MVSKIRKSKLQIQAKFNLNISCIVEKYPYICCLIENEMDKETFLKDIARIDSEIKAFEAAKRELEAEYIESNRRFNIGDKVKVIDPAYIPLGLPERKRFAFVKGFKVTFQGNVETILVKCKKDGTPSVKIDYASENKIHPSWTTPPLNRLNASK